MVSIRKNVKDDLTAKLNRGSLTPQAFNITDVNDRLAAIKIKA